MYEGRIAHATALIENDLLEQQVNAALASPQYSSDDNPASKTVRLEQIKNEETQAADRTSQIIAQADKLRAEVEVAKREIKERKERLARRQADLTQISNGIPARRSRRLEETEKAIHMTKYKWNRTFESTAATRSYLCMESARLYGLRRIKKSSKYELGGVEMIELPDMIRTSSSYSFEYADELTRLDASPEAISASLAHIAHILMLASTYLAIKLPAELTIPHHDYPKPTIFSLASSYRHGDVPFPGSVVIPPNNLADQNQKHVPRPRPLYIDKPLQTLAREDPAQYSLFIEGVVLLAYDIAWVCCTQGVPIGDKTSYEDVCNMGRNLYNLLIGNQLTNNPTTRLAQASDQASASESPAEHLGGPSTPMMGRYSHGTTHTFLGSAEGNEFVRNFKLPNPVKLADRLKKKMVSDADGLDWEMLEDDAWAPDEPMEQGVQRRLRTPGESDRRLFGVESVMSASTARTTQGSIMGDFGRFDVDIPSSPEKARSAGTSGWTKIKSR